MNIGPKATVPYSPFHGSRLRAREVAGFIVSETACSSGMKLEPHSHERAGFCMVLQGGFVEYRDRNERTYRPSDITFRPPGELHANRFLPTGGRCLNIEISAEPLQRLGTKAAAFTRPADYLDGRLSELALRIYRELRDSDSLSLLALEALALELLVETARGSHALPGSPRWMSRVKELLHERFAERLSLSEIAAAVDVHPAHLARTFRRLERQTVGDYVRQLRIRFALSRLSSTDESISAIAMAAGFYDQCHLNRALKRHTGVTPAQYRSAFRSGSRPRHSGPRLQS